MCIEKILMVNTPPHNLDDILNSGRSRATAKTKMGRSILPYGLLSISEYLESNGYSIDIKDMWDMNWEQISDYLQKEDPDIIFSSCLTDSRQSNFRLSKIAKVINSNIINVIGNAHASIMYEQILKCYPEIDYVILGEGEITSLELIEYLNKNKNINDVKGIAYRNETIYSNLNNICVTKRRPLANLDEFPFPTKHRFFINEPHNAVVNTSRGCPYGCTYCSLTKFWGNCWRGKSIKNVIEEIEFLHSEGVKSITFTDDHFTFNKRRALEIVSHFKDYDFSWRIQCRVDRINKELFSTFKKNNCDLVAFGVESMSPTILKNIHKGYTVDQVKTVFKDGHEIGIPVQANIMIGATGETQNTINETIQGIKEIKPDLLAKFITMIYPGTEMYRIMKEKGKISDDYWLTNNPAPFNLAEHDLATLRKFSLQVQSAWFKQKGIIYSTKEVYNLLKEHGYNFVISYIKDGLSRTEITQFLKQK